MRTGFDMVQDEILTPLLTVRDVARLLRVHNNTVRRWSDRGLLQSYRIGPRNERRFKREDLVAFISNYKSMYGVE